MANTCWSTRLERLLSAASVLLLTVCLMIRWGWVCVYVCVHVCVQTFRALQGLLSQSPSMHAPSRFITHFLAHSETCVFLWSSARLHLLACLLTYPLACSLTHSLTTSLTCWLARSLTDSPTALSLRMAQTCPQSELMVQLTVALPM